MVRLELTRAFAHQILGLACLPKLQHIRMSRTAVNEPDKQMLFGSVRDQGNRAESNRHTRGHNPMH